MGDFQRDFFIDPGVTIKQEIVDSPTAYNTTANVPIPGSGRRIVDYQEMVFDLDLQSPSYNQDAGSLLGTNDSNDGAMWGTRIELDLGKNDCELIGMDDDDIFQVDKADLIQGPTLAELNANDETLLGDLNFDDLLLPEESSYNYVNVCNKQNVVLGTFQQNNNNSSQLNNNSFPVGVSFYRENLELQPVISTNSFNAKCAIPPFSPLSQNSSSSSIHLQSSPYTTSPLQQKHSTLHELLMKKDKFDISPDRTVLGQSVPGRNTSNVNSNLMRVSRPHISRLSSSAPTHLGLEQIWQRREPRKHLLSTGSLAEAGSTSSLSTGGVLSPDPQDFSHDELDTDEDSDHYEDFSSDNGGDSDEEGDDHSTRSSSKRERYFWQYNVQAKGPKGQRLIMKSKMEDPHVLNEVTDPVFSPDCSVRGIKHSGKARKGDGNDLTPNPRKLYNIGKELDKLGRIINDMTPVSELPFNVRPKTRKEKNKLASRACRLKKKAQHEANKIKLEGLESEHKCLLNGITQVKHLLAAKLTDSQRDSQDDFTQHIHKTVKSATRIKIAGHTTEYVNKVLDKLKGSTKLHSLEDI